MPGKPANGTFNNELNLLNPNDDLARMANGNPVAGRTNTNVPNARLGNGDNHQPVHVTPQPVLNSAFAGVLADPSDLTALNSEATRVARQSVHVRRAGNVAARPSTTLESTATPAAAHPVHTVQVAQTPRPAVGSRSMHNGHLKTFDVAFDNTQIAFDVPPRVENGLPLAPSARSSSIPADRSNGITRARRFAPSTTAKRSRSTSVTKRPSSTTRRSTRRQSLHRPRSYHRSAVVRSGCHGCQSHVRCPYWSCPDRKQQIGRSCRTYPESSRPASRSIGGAGRLLFIGTMAW